MAINTIKPPTTTPRANVPREVVSVVPEPVRPPEPTPAPAPAPEPAPAPKAPRPEPRAPRSSWSVFTLLDRLTRMDGLFREGLPVRYLPHVLFIMFLTLVYIGNTHYAYRMNRNIQKLKLETEDLRADYTTLKSDYMEASKQSEVARKVAAYGLVESSSPPFRINVPAGRLDEASLDVLPVLSADSIAAQAKADSSAALLPANDPAMEAAPPGPVADDDEQATTSKPVVPIRPAPTAKQVAPPATSTHSATSRNERKY